MVILLNFVGKKVVQGYQWVCWVLAENVPYVSINLLLLVFSKLGSRNYLSTFALPFIVWYNTDLFCGRRQLGMGFIDSLY